MSSGKTVHIHQSDFDEGTYRIRKSGKYKLMEDIYFEPNPENDYRPYKNDSRYEIRAYILGFFAAITIECSNVELNLNGHSIQQTETFAAAQRYFAIIELASAPFIPGQGPGNFGEHINTAKRCTIANGVLGRSSHHSIHGNGNVDITIKNLTMKDFEVGGIAINGLQRGIFRNLQIGPGCNKVPVLGNFSAARFMQQFYDQAEYLCMKEKGLLIDEETSSPLIPKDVRSGVPTECVIDRRPLNKLNNEINKVLSEIKQTGVTTSSLFGNPDLLPDGNNYGLLVHVPGIAVNDYVEADFNGVYSNDITIRKVKITDINIKVREIVGISTIDGTGVQTDPSGSVLQILEIQNSNHTAKHNMLADAQMNLAKYIIYHGLEGKIGKNNIDENMVRWYYGRKKWSHMMGPGDGGYKYKCNGDSMFHVNKGNHGIRLDGVRNSNLEDIYIHHISNTGWLGNEEVGGRYEHSHDEQQRLGYHGADVTGMHFSYCKNIATKNCTIDDVHSDNGEARGYRLINQCQSIRMSDVEADNITAGYLYQDGAWYGKNYYGKDTEYTAGYPNAVPNAVGVVTDPNCKIILGRHRCINMKCPGAAVPVWTN